MQVMRLIAHPNARGAELFRVLRCQACHTIGDRPSELPPSVPRVLSRPGAYLRSDWLLGLFSDQSGEAAPQSNSMFDSVHGKFSASEAHDIVAWAEINEPERVRRVFDGARTR